MANIRQNEFNRCALAVFCTSMNNNILCNFNVKFSSLIISHSYFICMRFSKSTPHLSCVCVYKTANPYCSVDNGEKKKCLFFTNPIQKWIFIIKILPTNCSFVVEAESASSVSKFSLFLCAIVFCYDFHFTEAHFYRLGWC